MSEHKAVLGHFSKSCSRKSQTNRGILQGDDDFAAIASTPG